MKSQAALKNIQITDGCHKTLKGLADTTGVAMPKLIEVALTELSSQPAENIQIMADPQKLALLKQIKDLEAKLASYEKSKRS